MSRQLASCIVTQLRFFRRSRLLLVIGLLLLVTLALSFVPTLVFGTRSQRFTIVTESFQGLTYFSYLFAAALGLLSVSTQLRDRSIKLVATKPVPMSIWLLSHLAAAGVVLLFLAAATVALTVGLLLFWGIPVQSGFLWLGFYTFCRSMLLFSYLTLLSTLFHPVLAGLAALMVHDQTFYFLSTLTASARGMVESALYQGFLAVIERVLFGIYTVFPVIAPFAAAAARVSSAYRIEAQDWRSLGLTVLYTATIAALSFALTLALLRRRRLT